MANYREIVTKAVIAKGKKLFTTDDSVTVDNKPTTVLGCWVINHNFNGVKYNDQIRIDGSYDVNIWYSYDNDSKTTVVNKKIDYNDLFNVKVKENADLSNDTDIIVRTLKQPNCIGVNIDENGNINSNSTWISNMKGAVECDTVEQKLAVEFYNNAISAARNVLNNVDGDIDITVCGHSTGGNQAQYVTIAYEKKYWK